MLWKLEARVIISHLTMREREREKEEIFTFSSLDIEYFSIFVPCLGLKPIDQSEIGLITLVRSLGC